MEKTSDKKIVLKRIKKTLILLTIANYIAFLHMLYLLVTSGVGAKILDFILKIY